MNTRHSGGIVALAVGVLLSLASLAHAAPFAYVTQSFSNTDPFTSNTVSVVDTATNTVATTVTVGFTPFGVAVHPAGSHVYVGNVDDGTVSVIETATNTVVATVPVGLGPSGLAVHPNGSRLYVANQFSDSLSIVDTSSYTVNTVPLGAAARGPLGVAVNATGTRLYIVNNLSSNMVIVDTATLTMQMVQVGSRPVGVAVDPAGARVYVTNAMDRNVWVLDADGVRVGNPIPVGFGPRGVAVHPSGSHVYVATGTGIYVIATSNNQVTGPLGAPSLYGISVTPSGGHVYAASEEGLVVVLDTTTTTVTGQIQGLDGASAFGTFITPEATACDTTELEQALAAAERQVAALSSANQALTSANQALTDENARLRAELASLQATVDSFVDRLFGGRADANVAEAARAAALARLAEAKQAAPKDWRLRVAQQAFEQGDHAVSRQDWGRAVHEFRTCHEMAERILDDGSQTFRRHKHGHKK